jgi:muconolactone delta-isomerase
MSGKLDGALGYLSGPMEFVADHGVEWRRKFIRLVRDAGLDIDLIDPTDKPGGENVKIGENKAVQVELQQQGRFRELQEYVNEYRRYDLRFVDISDFLVTVIDPRVPQWGTGNEVYVGEMQHKPNFFICEGGLYNLPRWLFDVVDKIESDDPEEAMLHCNVYESVEDVVRELIFLNSGLKPLSKEWVLVRKDIEARRAKSES